MSLCVPCGEVATRCHQPRWRMLPLLYAGTVNIIFVFNQTKIAPRERSILWQSKIQEFKRAQTHYCLSVQKLQWEITPSQSWVEQDLGKSEVLFLSMHKVHLAIELPLSADDSRAGWQQLVWARTGSIEPDITQQQWQAERKVIKHDYVRQGILLAFFSVPASTCGWTIPSAKSQIQTLWLTPALWLG